MSNTVNTTLEAVGAVTAAWNGATSSSLIDYTKQTRVEPIVIIASTLREQPYMPDLMKALNSIFSGYYLQAVAVSTNVGKVDTLRLLDKLSTKRSPIRSAVNAMDRHVATEAYEDGFPLYNHPDFATEARNDKPSSAGFGKDTVGKAYDDVNLSVGKLLEVNISDGEHSATIPVAVRLMVRQMPNSDLVNVLSIGSKDRSMKERYHDFRQGDLRFWRDLMLCQDIIRDHKRMLKADSRGGFSEATRTKQKNRLAGIFSLDPSVNSISSIAVIDSNMAKSIERQAKIKLKRFRSRQELMESTSLMLLVVVDTEYEVATIYHNGLESTTELSAKEIKSASKGKEADVGDILKQYLDSRAPTL